MPHPFLDVTVSPTYGHYTARIIWRVSIGWEKGIFNIFKSDDGVTEFKQIGSVENQTDFEDAELLPIGKFTETYYKVTTETRRTRILLRPIGTFGKITREEFCVARYILSLESRVMKRFTRIMAFQLASGKFALIV